MKKFTRLLNYFKSTTSPNNTTSPEPKISNNDASFGASEATSSLLKKENLSIKSRKEIGTEKPEPASEEVTANGEEEETSGIGSEKESPPAANRKRGVREIIMERNAKESAVKKLKEKQLDKIQNAKVSSNKADKSPKKPAVVADSGSHNLPKGWVRQFVVRKSGKSAGQIDVYIYNPDGVKFRSKPEIAAYLKKTRSNLKLDLFDFSKKAAQSDAPVTPEKKESLVSKAKLLSPKTKPAMPKKNTKLLVKIVSEKGKKKGPVKKSPEKKVRKATAKGKKSSKVPLKDNKKKNS